MNLERETEVIEFEKSTGAIIRSKNNINDIFFDVEKPYLLCNTYNLDLNFTISKRYITNLKDLYKLFK